MLGGSGSNRRASQPRALGGESPGSVSTTGRNVILNAACSRANLLGVLWMRDMTGPRPEDACVFRRGLAHRPFGRPDWPGPPRAVLTGHPRWTSLSSGLLPFASGV